MQMLHNTAKAGRRIDKEAKAMSSLYVLSREEGEHDEKVEKGGVPG
jgi:hypothetical protein